MNFSSDQKPKECMACGCLSFSRALGVRINEVSADGWRCEKCGLFVTGHGHISKTKPINSREIYGKALDKWGYAAQFNMVIEECIELALALQHYDRGKCSKDDVTNEIADVAIMIEQAPLILGIPVDAIERAKQNKLNRLAGRLEET